MLSYLERFYQVLPVVALALLIALVYVGIEHFVTNKGTASAHNVQHSLKSRWSILFSNTFVSIWCLFQRNAK
jgi:hypothetical protein